MAPLASTPRLLLAALLLGSSVPARAEEKPVPAAKVDSRSEAQKLQDRIKEACEAPAVEVRLLDPAAPRKDGEAAPANPKREKEAQAVANRLGAGVESEADDAGQTLTRKRGKTTKAKCRGDLSRVARMYPGRVEVGPTTEERVEKVRQVREAVFTKKLMENPGDAAAAQMAFDGGIFGKLFGSKPDAVAASPAPASLRPSAAGYGTGRPSLAQYRGALASPPPMPVSYAPTSYTRRAAQAYEATSAYVSSSIDEAGKWVSGVARSVRNRFYSGIEMIQGFGYKFIHAGRQSNWGTQPLVDGLRTIAAYMRGTGKAGTDLAIGDLSSAAGGKLGGHLSHQTGRDVDIGFYMTDGAGGPVDALGFVRFVGGRDRLSGSAGGRTVRFDAERNWMLIEAILANPDPAFKPTNIFIAKHLESAVLAAGASSPHRDRAAALMTDWPGHDNHLHLRVQ